MTLVPFSPARNEALIDATRPLYAARKLAKAIKESKVTDLAELGADAYAKLAKDAQMREPEVVRAILDKMVAAAQQSEGRHNIRSIASEVARECSAADKAYDRVREQAPRMASVFGVERGKRLEGIRAAEMVVSKHKALEPIGLSDMINTEQAELRLAELRPEMRAFAESYDAMLRGEVPVSDVFAEATVFALFDELKGKDLPAFFEGLADVIRNAEESLLTGLFHRRWLEPEGRRGPGTLVGDLDLFVQQLDRFAADLRKGSFLGRSKGWGERACNPQDFLRSEMGSDDTPTGGWGLIPTFVFGLAWPSFSRDELYGGNPPTENVPTYRNTPPAPITMTVEPGDNGATRIVIS